jgi:hypothetical protein
MRKIGLCSAILMRRTRATSPFAIFWWLWFSTHNSGGSGVSTITATALAIDGDSHVLVANGQTEVLSNAGVIVSTTQGSTSASPSSIAIDNSGSIWAAKRRPKP